MVVLTGPGKKLPPLTGVSEWSNEHRVGQVTAEMGSLVKTQVSCYILTWDPGVFVGRSLKIICRMYACTFYHMRICSFLK